MKKLVGLVLLFLFLLFFGCTISVNPKDLAPSKNYSVIGGGDSNYSLNNSNGIDSNITLNSSEVLKHSSVGNCWMIINGNVYDLSAYVAHPGGSGYLKYCGKEATVPYDTKDGRGVMHSSYSDALLENYLVGKLGQTVIVNDVNVSINPLTPQTSWGDNDNEFEDDD